uniref:Uncharacterized protein n=1 Tax=Oryza sativa subsp. japonica TaxID=39947 RepID=Q651A7_ORYSJ|nr:hypothetical protein [Oryza sativa Japonica Group]
MNPMESYEIPMECLFPYKFWRNFNKSNFPKSSFLRLLFPFDSGGSLPTRVGGRGLAGVPPVVAVGIWVLVGGGGGSRCPRISLMANRSLGGSIFLEQRSRREVKSSDLGYLGGGGGGGSGDGRRCSTCVRAGVCGGGGVRAVFGVLAAAVESSSPYAVLVLAVVSAGAPCPKSRWALSPSVKLVLVVVLVGVADRIWFVIRIELRPPAQFRLSGLLLEFLRFNDESQATEGDQWFVKPCALQLMPKVAVVAVLRRRGSTVITAAP